MTTRSEWEAWQKIVRKGPAHPEGSDGTRECQTGSRLDGCPDCDAYEQALSLYVDTTEHVNGTDHFRP